MELTANTVSSGRAETPARTAVPVLWIGPYPAPHNGISEYSERIVSGLRGDAEVRTERLYFTGLQKDYPVQLGRSVAAVLRASRAGVKPVVHLQYCPFSTGPGAVFLAGIVSALRLPLVTTVHEGRKVVRFAKGKLYANAYPFIEDRILSFSDVIVVHSETQRRELPRWSREKAVLIEFGIDECESAPAEPADANVVGCFGIIAEYKGIDTVVKACALASERVPDLRLVIAGTVPRTPRMRGYYSELSKLATEALGDRVTIAADVSDEEFDRLYHRASIVAFGLRSVTQSTTFFRAVAHAKPIVTTDVGGVAEVTRREGLGRVVPIGSPREMAAAIAGLLLDDRDRESMAVAARALVARNTWERNAREHLEIYRRLAARKAA